MYPYLYLYVTLEGPVDRVQNILLLRTNLFIGKSVQRCIYLSVSAKCQIRSTLTTAHHIKESDRQTDRQEERVKENRPERGTVTLLCQLGAQLKRGKCCHNAHLVVSNAPYKLMPIVATSDTNYPLPLPIQKSLFGISDVIMPGHIKRETKRNDAMTLTEIISKRKKRRKNPETRALELGVSD